MTKKGKFKLWLPVVLWAGVIFLLSSLPINKVTTFSWMDFVIKKTAHVVEYAIFYWLSFRAISEKGRKLEKKMFVLPLIMGIFYAFTDEWHQTMVPGRQGTLRDVGFDTIGLMLSLSQIKKNI